MLAGVACHDDTRDVLVRRVVPVPKEQFVSQHKYRLELSTQAINGLAALCEANKLGAVLCHSHPEDIPYSPTDDFGERRIFQTLRNFIPSNAPTASLLLHPGGTYARVWLQNPATPVLVDELLIVGRAIQRFSLNKILSRGAPEPDGIHSRQVLAFGQAGQQRIAETKVGIVGAGGTGSACAEQLARLGVQDLFLMDYDGFDKSNLSRMYGTFESDLRSRKKKAVPKVDLLERHLKLIDSSIRIKTLVAHAAEARAASLLLDRDIIFLCTDDHWGRAIVNQICYQYLIPCINLGVRIDAPRGAIIGAAGVVDVLRPELPCLWCKQFLRSDRISDESMPVGERTRLQREGYVEGLNTPAPSVISLTTAVAGLAVTMFLQLVTDFMQEQGEVSRLNYDILDSTVRRGAGKSATNCVCKAVRGFGDLKPLPTH